MSASELVNFSANIEKNHQTGPNLLNIFNEDEDIKMPYETRKPYYFFTPAEEEMIRYICAKGSNKNRIRNNFNYQMSRDREAKS